MKRFKKVYLEISNVCNLKCAFCPGTRRVPGIMSEDTFSLILSKLQPWTDFLYFHLMGEPLCHPQLERFLAIAGERGFKVILTTNGTLLPIQQDILLQASALHKVNISLHAFEANDLSISYRDYIEGCLSYAQQAQGNKLTVFRLWNNGGANAMNDEILNTMKSFFPDPWKKEPRGTRIGNRVYLEHGDKFDWPDLSAEQRVCHFSCYGLRDQIGILCDGTVVPCCLDHDGDIPLGNLITESLTSILDSPRAVALYNGFAHHEATEELCRRCGYADRFR